MAILECLVILIFLCFVVFYYKPQILKTLIRRDWLRLSVLSDVIKLERLHKRLTKTLNRRGGTFMWKGPWFANMDILVTTDPLDINHILSQNFSNYPKGPKFRLIFDFFGDGIFNVDGHLWKTQRKTITSLFRQPSFQSVFEAIVWKKVERGLLPVLESLSKPGKEMDLQDIFQRFTFDTICTLLLDYDPKSLSLDFPFLAHEKSFTDIEEALLYRHFIPPAFWKLQQLLKMGNERKLSEACNVLRHFVLKCFARIQHDSNNLESEHGKEYFGLASLIKEFKGQSGSYENPDKFLREIILNLIGAGRDTTSSALSWFFYLVAKNSIVEDKIREEIHKFMELKADDYQNWNSKELNKLVYLHGALCEALRLYPPVPFNHKCPLQQDILPSGHKVNQNTKIILYFYGMGRMKSIWGEDCMEFKPERWISEEGGIKHEPSYKFPAFNGGPRTCLGMDMSFTQLKIVASAIIYRFHIELVEGHVVCPSASIVLQMKHGLKVRLTRISGVVV